MMDGIDDERLFLMCDAAKTYPSPADLLPHAAPMIRVDRITAVTTDAICGEVELRTDGGESTQPGGGIPVAWSIEIIAQLCAAYIGLEKRADGIRGGRLIRVRDARFHVDLLPAGETLAICSRLEGESAGGTFIFAGSIAVGDRLLAEAGVVIVVQ